jgi:ornithine cyclodeaminase
MAIAHCAVREIKYVSVWGRRQDRARAVADEIRKTANSNVQVLTPASLPSAVGEADIVSCVTSSATPVLAGKWLRPGTFVDLVGSFSPSTREADDDVMRHARIFVDTFSGALTEAGDILDPMARGVIQRQQVQAELAELVRGQKKGRLTDDEITVFKSVGAAIEDIATAQMLIEGHVPAE